MIKDRYMVWPIKRNSVGEIGDEWRGFATLERALEQAQRFSNSTGLQTCIEHQTYQVSRGHGYELLESDFGPWSTDPEGTK